ncbi:hypothetical protein [Acidithiobacillus ferriphilus]|uniref:hypothetical protein n=1 Tax=Acidithiobacillus ferriphilus TaxID=1689834 RepID=UPI001C065BC9|nr:hypothetical protein [Acidithiobacillus ferriphilus]MBU2830505.1 hypothetical protein [Acidithiobacillus ferriphilus]
MSEISQYKFSLSDVASLLMQKEGITEGLWTIGVGFNISVASAGPDKDHVRPATLVAVDNLVLSKATNPGPLTFNAAELTSSGKR